MTLTSLASAARRVSFVADGGTAETAGVAEEADRSRAASDGDRSHAASDAGPLAALL